MTEKQRWLLRELEAWQTKQLESIGKWGPKRNPKEPATVKAARRARKEATRVIEAWESDKKAPWTRAKKVIDGKYQTVRRVILFEKTETALKALKALR